MSTYVPGYQNDIFVSYAHVDNEPLVEADKGWVTTLITTLKKLLGAKLGRPDAYSLWMDDRLSGNQPVTPYIDAQLKSTATFLLILSPGYVESCSLEFNTFLQQIGPGSGRIFMVEKNFIERENKQPELQRLRGYPFWVRNADTDEIHTLAVPRPNPDREPEYYRQLDALAEDLTKQLKHLKTLVKKIEPPAPETISLSSGKYTIFLAEVPDDLVLRREELKRNLELQGLRVLPETLYYFPSSEALQQAIDADLKKAAVFVQLLSASLPQRPPGMSTPQLQYDRAKSLGMPISQWRDRTLEIDTVQDPALRALLTGSTVMATGILEFQQHILQFLKKLETDKNAPKKPATDNCSLIFVNAERQDMALAHKIEEMLINKGVGCSLPLEIAEDTDPAAVRADLEENLLSCDAVLVIDDANTPLPWVRKQLLHCTRISSKREQSFKAVVRCNNASTPKPPLNIRLPYLHIVDYPAPPPHLCISKLLEVLAT
jgi:hypothetical protein